MGNVCGRWLVMAVVGLGWISFGYADATVSLSSLDLSKMSSGWGTPQENRSIEGTVLTFQSRPFPDGVGTHAVSKMYLQLDGKVKRFSALVGIDDETQGKGSVVFQVIGDGNTLFDSGVMKGKEPAKPVNVALEGIRQLILIVFNAKDGGDHDHANWVDAKFVYAGEAPVAIDAPVYQEEPYFLTPKPGVQPKINAPSVYGCRPGRPFLYRIPCTGERPIEFAAESLPESLRLDSSTGIITGDVPMNPGEYCVQLQAKNQHGEDGQTFTIVVGDALALTPPMGWNHWYTYYTRVNDKLFRDAAEIMIQSGMADFGYQYVNIDDCWMMKPGSEDPQLNGESLDRNGAIRANLNFPDMTAMCDFIHGLGLKAGIYTSPGTRTCAGYQGTYQHEQNDAQRFADWGFDFLKYDWCSYGHIAKDQSLEEFQKPYRQMGDILKALNRDVVFNLCQYGMGDVWKWGGEVGGHCWRTTGDLGLEEGDLLPGFYSIGFSNALHADYAKPGQWNDPDYILIGMVGNAWDSNQPPQVTSLTPSEQYSYMSMWCLMAAPLFYSGDITRLDDFTLNILCNAEVIEVDQDPLGIQGRIVRKTDREFVLAKPLQDGSLAVGLFNLSDTERTVTVTWDQLGIRGVQQIRDLWRQENLSKEERQYSASVRRHGVSLVRLIPEK